MTARTDVDQIIANAVQRGQIVELRDMLAEAKAEIVRLKRHIEASEDVHKSMADEIAKLVRERDHMCEWPTLEGAAPGVHKVEQDGLSFVVYVPSEGIATIHEVEVPNEDEVVSYEGRRK